MLISWNVAMNQAAVFARKARLQMRSTITIADMQEVAAKL
jgi:hypothetical protein